MAGIRVSINRGEEKPLLVSVNNKRSGKGSDDETYIDHKYGRPMSTIKKWQYDHQGGNGRGQQMMMGAVNVINRWPDHLAVCWMIAVAISMVIIIGVLMLENTYWSTSPQHFTYMSLQKQCKSNHKDVEISEKTNIYLHIILNDDESFNLDKYDSVFNGVKEHHPNHMINLIVLYNDTVDTSYRRNTRFKDWELYNNQLDKPKFFQTSSMEEDPTLEHKKEEVLNYTNLKFIRSTFSTYFKHSPLRYRWKIMAPEMMPFILRVLTLWEKGGITMPWQLFIDKTDIYCLNKSASGKLHDIVVDLKKAYVPEVKSETPEIKENKELIDEIKTYVDLNKDVHVSSSSSEEESSYSYYNEVSESEQTTFTPSAKLKMKNKAKEDLSEMTVQIKLTGLDTDSIMEATPLSNRVDSRVAIKNRKDKERVFIPDDKLVRDLDSDIHVPSDSEVIDREIEKVKKKPKNLPQKNLDDNNAEESEKPRKRRVKRDINVKQEELGKFGNKKHKDFIPPKSLLEYKHESLEYHSSEYDYYSDSDYESYSGLNAKEPFKTNRGNKKEVDFNLNWSSDTNSNEVDELDRLASSSEESSDVSRNYYKESKAYVHHNVFDNVNVFSLPSRTNLALDKFGYYFSTKKPCHAFLGMIISNLQSSYDLADPDTAVSDSLKSFCKGRKFNDCVGLALL